MCSCRRVLMSGQLLPSDVARGSVICFGVGVGVAAPSTGRRHYFPLYEATRRSMPKPRMETLMIVSSVRMTLLSS